MLKSYCDLICHVLFCTWEASLILKRSGGGVDWYRGRGEVQGEGLGGEERGETAAGMKINIKDIILSCVQQGRNNTEVTASSIVIFLECLTGAKEHWE